MGVCVCVLVGHQEEHLVCKSQWFFLGVTVWASEHSASICIWYSWCHQHTTVSCFIKVGMVYFCGLPGCVAGRCGLCVLLLFLLFYASNRSVDEAGCIMFWGCPSISVYMCICACSDRGILQLAIQVFFRKPNLVFLLVNGFYWFLCEVSYVTCSGWLKKLVVEFFCAGPRWVFRWRMETSILEYLKMPSNVLLMGFEL